MLCGYALTVTFVPGDRHLIVGLKDGKMLIIDIASGDILEEVSAHSKELWSVTLFPDLVIFQEKYSDIYQSFINLKFINMFVQIERSCQRW